MYSAITMDSDGPPKLYLHYIRIKILSHSCARDHIDIKPCDCFQGPLPDPCTEKSKLGRAGAKSTENSDVGNIAEVKRQAKRYGWALIKRQRDLFNET